MKYALCVLVIVLVCSCSSRSTFSENYLLARNGDDTIFIFPTNEVVLLDGGRSYHFSTEILNVDGRYNEFHDKDDLFVVFSEYGSPYHLYDGYVSLLRDSKTQEIDLVEVTVFYPYFLVDAELDIYKRTFSTISNTKNNIERARQILFKERDASDIILRTEQLIQ